MIVPLVLVMPLVFALADDLPLDVRDALATGSASSIRAQVRFLASDLCEGRAPGTRGGEIAAKYLAARLEGMGLEPAGEDGTFFQRVPLIGAETRTESARVQMSAGGQSFDLPFLDSFVGSDLTFAETTDVSGELLFVGYGIDAPEQGWDDYAGLDVRGRILLMLVNDPPSEDPSVFGGAGLTYYGRWTYKYEEAARRGAAGAVLIHRSDMAGYDWTVVRNSWGREKPYVDNRGSGANDLRLAAWVRDAAFEPVLAQLGTSVQSLVDEAVAPGFRPRDLDVAVDVHLETRTRALDTSNVAGLLRGDSRADEVVVYSAHYDHLGQRYEPKGDGVYNGAVDNATGCGVVLEVARMFRSMRSPPARSILFLFVTAEEGGLRGSEYFSDRPTVPLDKIAANINIDSTVVVGDPLDYEPLGYDRSTLKTPMERVARAFGVGLLPDSRPEQGIFYRSDHFSFAKKGVPAVYLKHGPRFADRPVDWGVDAADDYRRNRYHQPADEFDPSWDFVGTLKTARIAFALGALVANDDEMPAYFPGDEFHRARSER